jgi:NAD(P)-dependent dehydrogenase (short-subunit alcohol dehydrogenase family)
MRHFHGKVVFITGGASGVGLGQAKVFAEAGTRVVIADIRQGALDAALTELRASGARVHGIRLDVTDRDAFARAAEETERVFGPVDLLFNTAGVFTFGALEHATYADYDWTMSVNFGGVVNGIQTFVPRMIARGGRGHIVNTASMSAFYASGFAGIYAASKFAVRGLTEALREALAPYGIGVSVLCPASVDTNIAESSQLRPEGNYGFHTSAALMGALRKLYAQGMNPMELARHVKAAIERNDAYVIPYPEERRTLQGNLQAVLAAIPPESSDLEGVARRRAALDKFVADLQAMAAARPGGAR